MTNTNAWNNALEQIQNRGNDQAYIIYIYGDISNPGISSLSRSFGNGNTNITVLLQGNGKLYLNSPGNIFNLGNGHSLIIDSDELILEGLTSGKNYSTQDNNNPIINVDNNGKLELKNGTISGNTSSSGGGVHIWSGGSFIMSGGIISNNTSVGGSGVIVSGTFTMKGGIISGNTSIGNDRYDYGGGVDIGSNGNFNKVGGIIYGENEGINSNIGSSSDGHAVYWYRTEENGGTLTRNSTLGVNDNISTSDPFSILWDQND